MSTSTPSIYKIWLQIVGLRSWVPHYAPTAGAVVYCKTGLCDSSGKWLSKRKTFETTQVKEEKEVVWNDSAFVIEVGSQVDQKFVRIVCLERRFRSHEAGVIMLELSRYTKSDRVDRWFKLSSSGDMANGEKKGELRVRIRFTETPEFEETPNEKDFPPRKALGSKKSKTIDSKAETEADRVNTEPERLNNYALMKCKYGEPDSWVLLDFVRGQTEQNHRKGVIYLRIQSISNMEESNNVSLSVICGDQITHMKPPKLNQFLQFNVSFEPESSLVKVYLFRFHGELPVASCSLCFEDNDIDINSKEFLKVIQVVTKSVGVVEQNPVEFSNIKLLGDEFTHIAPKQYSLEEKQPYVAQKSNLIIFAVILFVHCLYLI